MGFSNQQFWLEIIGSNGSLRRWVVDGYSEYLPRLVPVIVRDNNPNTAQHHQFVSNEVVSLLGIDAVEDVTDIATDTDEVRVVAPLTVAENAVGKLRLCWNGRPMSPYLILEKFKMEHAQVAAKMMRKGDLMMTMDMKSGYHQIPVKSSFRRYLCFQWNGRVYRWKVLPFGLATAPRAYSKLSRALVKHWRKLGIRCSNYIDDFIFFASTTAEAERIRVVVLGDLSRLGWFVSLHKSMLAPGTRVRYLGLEFCSMPVPHLRIPKDKVDRVKKSLGDILTSCSRKGLHNARFRGRTIASVVGFLQSLRLAVPMVGLFTRELIACLGQLPLGLHGYAEFGALVPLTAAALLECKFWKARIGVWNGHVLPPSTVSRILYTDASGEGYGGVLKRVLGRRIEPVISVLSGRWESWVSQDSVYTELLGLWRALVAAGDDLVGQVVLHRTDNVSSYWVLSKGGSQISPRLTAIVRLIWLYVVVFGIQLCSDYVGADVIINSGADYLSRVHDTSDVMLQPTLFGKLWDVFGPFAVDCFASAASVQHSPVTARPLPYMSMFADASAVGVHALRYDWRLFAGKCYVFPPVKLIGDVVTLLAEQQVPALIIVPDWPSQWWWPVLHSMASMSVRLTSIHTGPLFKPVRPGGPVSPLGSNFANAQQVEWVAVYVNS